MTTRRSLATLVVAALLATFLAACSPGAPAGYDISADFSRGIGLFPGAPVRELGVNIGVITKVGTRGTVVRVAMHIDKGRKLRADVKAVIVPMSLLGERYIQVSPIYTGGPTLAAGARIPIERTAVPVEIDELLRGLRTFLEQVDPSNVGDLVTNLAQVLQGEGDKLNRLVQHAAGTLQVLADKGESLGGLIDSLAQLTTALATRTAAIDRLIRSYDTVSGVVAQNRATAEGAITQLNRAAQALADLLSAHQQPLKRDVEGLTTVGRSLQRNLDSIDLTLRATPRLFNAAHNAYDPTNNWLPLNNQGDTTTSSQLYSSRIRDRLAGVCRRLLARSPAPPTALQQCADPSSGFFDPILALIPTNQGGSPPKAPAASNDQLFRQGLESIPGLDAAEKAALAGEPAAATTTSSTVPSLDGLLPPLPRLPAAGPHTSGGLLGGIARLGRSVVRSVVDLFAGLH